MLSNNISEVASIYDVLLRDQMRIGYLQGFELKEHSNEKLWRANITECYKLIDLALLLTNDVIA